MNKWETLEHNGPLFVPEYDYKGFDKNLSSLAEEMLYHYAARLNSDYAKDKLFNKNFYEDLKPNLPKDYQLRKFPNDFMPLLETIYNYIQEQKEKRKLVTKEDKEKIKLEKEAIKEKYGYCTLNGEKQPIASPYIEGPGIFFGRGEMPQSGRWKARVQPEDVIINASNYKDIKAPEGHTWKDALENKKSTELASYSITLSTGFTIYKKVQFAATSCIKQSNDQKKFEKAKTLLQSWDKVKNHIEKNIFSNNKKIKQEAMVSWLIMNLGIRVGDEKGEDTADTVGASSLRKCHIQVENNIIKLNFKGKDSVDYVNEFEAPELIAKEFSKIIESTYGDCMIFPDVRSFDITEFLSSAVENLTAKVFRTAHGSSLLASELRNTKINKNMSVSEKVYLFNEANFQVAKKLNHQKNVGKKKDKEKSKANTEKLNELKASYKEDRERFTKQIEYYKNQVRELPNKKLKADEKQLLKKSYNEKIEKATIKLEKSKERLENFKRTIEMKEKCENVALSTSKANYCDPRIGISFCKRFDIPIEKIYNSSMQKKFEWALDIEDDYFERFKEIK